MSEPAWDFEIIDASNDDALRGDPISGDRYYSREFMQKEWDHMWTRIWHVAGREQQLQEAGDYIVHDFMHESVIIIRQDDGSLKGFFNVCLHRGQRLVWDNGHTEGMTCPYHGWVWGPDGALTDLPDPEDFPQGNPCGKLALKEVRVDTWAGLVWYNMDHDAPGLYEFLDPLPTIYKNWPTERLVRTTWLKVELETNWKFAPDNFSESYHTRTAHPQVPPYIDQDYWTARHEMFHAGHGRIVQLGRPSLRDIPAEGEPQPFDDILREWEIDPDSYPDFETKAVQGWEDLKKQKRKLWREKGYLHYEHMTDEEIVDSPHNCLFPNVTISFIPDGMILFRTEPHPDDPNKCTFDMWAMMFPVHGQAEIKNISSTAGFEEAELDYRVFDGGRGMPEMAGQIFFQDMMLAEGQQRGMRSMAYEDAYLAGQETRVRRFHEVLNDYIEGRR